MRLFWYNVAMTNVMMIGRATWKNGCCHHVMVRL